MMKSFNSFISKRKTNSPKQISCLEMESSNLAFLEENKNLITGLGVGILMASSSYSACSAIVQASVHAIPLGRKKSILTNAYVAVIMASTIFIYAMILGTVIINKLDKSMDPLLSLRYFVSCTIFGLGSYFCGLAFGELCRKSYSVLDKKENYYMLFLCTLSTAEIVTLFAFLIALYVVL